jgi:hypothetical protein
MTTTDDVHALRWRKTFPDAELYLAEIAKERRSHPSLECSARLSNVTYDRYYDLISKTPVERHPKFKRTAAHAIAQSFAAARFFLTGQNSYEVTAELGSQLEGADLSDVIASDLKFPSSYFWLSLSHIGQPESFPGEPNVIDGVYVDAILKDMIFLTFTSRRIHLEDGAEWPANVDALFEVLLPLPIISGVTFRECLDYAVKEGFVRLDATRLSIKEDNIGRPRISRDSDEVRERKQIRLSEDGTRYVALVGDYRNDLQEAEWNRQALTIVERALAKVAAFFVHMSMPPSERSEVTAFPSDAPAELLEALTSGTSSGKKQRAAEELQRNGFRRINVIGLSAVALAQWNERRASGELSFSHTRRGHYRSQAFGPKFSLRRIVWVEEMRVRPDLPTRSDDGHRYIVAKD